MAECIYIYIYVHISVGKGDVNYKELVKRYTAFSALGHFKCKCFFVPLVGVMS